MRWVWVQEPHCFSVNMDLTPTYPCSPPQILTANDMCSLLLGEEEEKLCGGSRRLTDFISCPATARYLASLAPDTPCPEEVVNVTHSLPFPLLPPPQGLGVTDGKDAVVFSGRVVSFLSCCTVCLCYCRKFSSSPLGCFNG